MKEKWKEKGKEEREKRKKKKKTEIWASSVLTTKQDNYKVNSPNLA